MGRKSPFTEWVYEAWDELVLDNGDRLTFAEKQEKWTRLYERTYITGAWTVGLDDASLVANVGMNLAIEAEDYPLAGERARQLMAHPEMTRTKLISYQFDVFYVSEAFTDLVAGNISPAVARLRSGLMDPDRDSAYLSQLGGWLLHFASLAGHDEAADPAVVDLAADLVVAGKGLKRTLALLKSPITYGQLDVALNEFFEVRRRRRARRSNLDEA